MSRVVVKLPADFEDDADLSIHSPRDCLLRDWESDDCDDLPRLPASIRKLSNRSRRVGMTVTAVLLLLAAAAWLGRLSASPDLFPFTYTASPQAASSAASAHSSAAEHASYVALSLSTIFSNNKSPSPAASSSLSDCSSPNCPARRPAAFMSLFHNTLLPDLSLANQPYPVNTTRLPGGELPELNVYYCMSAEWFAFILDDTFPAVFKSYRRVDTWDPNMKNLWSLQAFSDDSHPVPSTINRAIGQRRIFITGEPQPSENLYDMDAVFDTKTSPFSHPAGTNFVYFPNVYAAHYDFIKAGQPKLAEGEQPKYDLSLIKPDHYSQHTNFTQRKFMAYMQNHCVAYRDDFFDLISQYKHVDAIGSCRHNVPDTFDNKGAWWHAIQIYDNYKFVLTLESSILDGYITEKILGPMITGAIPVYIGSSDIGDHFNERAFINVGRYSSLEKVMERIIYLDQNDTAYAEMLDEPWLHNNQPSMWMPHNNNGSYFHQQLAALRDVLLHPNYEQRMKDGLPKWAKEERGWQRPNESLQYLRG